MKKTCATLYLLALIVCNSSLHGLELPASLKNLYTQHSSTVIAGAIGAWLGHSFYEKQCYRGERPKNEFQAFLRPYVAIATGLLSAVGIWRTIQAAR